MASDVHLYTDGACSGNPGPGGWGAVLVTDGSAGMREKTLSGGSPATTNNRMELTAVIEALRALKRPCSVVVHTDSQYIANAFGQGWLERWQRNGWRTADKKPVKNKDLWQDLLQASVPHSVRWEWLRGHAGHPRNEQADRLAVAACRAFKP